MAVEHLGNLWESQDEYFKNTLELAFLLSINDIDSKDKERVCTNSIGE